MNSWTFRPDIGVPNIRLKVPEAPANIKIAGQTDMLINGWTKHMRGASETKRASRLPLLASFALLTATLLCAGCQTFRTEEEFQAQMNREHAACPFLQPGWYGTWQP